MLANYSVEVLVSVVVSNICYFHPEPWGNDPQSDEHIFQMGWNHQLVLFGTPWKINGWNPQITHLERKMIFQTSMIMWV